MDQIRHTLLENQATLNRLLAEQRNLGKQIETLKEERGNAVDANKVEKQAFAAEKKKAELLVREYFSYVESAIPENAQFAERILVEGANRKVTIGSLLNDIRSGFDINWPNQGNAAEASQCLGRLADYLKQELLTSMEGNGDVEKDTSLHAATIATLRAVEKMFQPDENNPARQSNYELAKASQAKFKTMQPPVTLFDQKDAEIKEKSALVGRNKLAIASLRGTIQSQQEAEKKLLDKLKELGDKLPAYKALGGNAGNSRNPKAIEAAA